MATVVSERLRELGIVLPPPPPPAGTYRPVVVDGDYAYVSGQIPRVDGKSLHPGTVGSTVALADAQTAAAQAALQAVSALAAELGTLDRVRRIVRVGVFVAATPDFTQHADVGNGATELLIRIFGEDGRPARVSMGVASLPLGACVEVELLARLG
ncbi:MAG: RidA family protein [Thermoplasmata archaeon]|jgi:enamine deaminase RidA (YjgF/YER057c/UK114 family)|nr:RidA family protein [Thermoplasmata archaeon]